MTKTTRQAFHRQTRPASPRGPSGRTRQTAYKISAVANPPQTSPRAPSNSLLHRLLRVLSPTRAHSAYTATVLLMVSTFLSRIMGLVRVKYMAWLFGSNLQADALTAAFVLPEMISYFLVGGAASITFVTILTRYRAEGREAEAQRSLSVILTTMALVLGGAILLAELAAPWYVHHWFPKFDTQKAALTVQLTRILLPAQLCFFAGGVFGAVLLVRKQFSVQAVTPLVYNLGTILGGVLLYRYAGVSSLAIGTVAGAFAGPFLLNAIYAWRLGTRYQPLLDWRDRGFREWVRLSLPLMIGVSLVTFDGFLISHYASGTNGAVALMNYAKQLFTAPMAVLAQAAGAASMPFFASLWSRERYYDFAVEVADSVSRVIALALLAAGGMIALAPPLVQLLFLGGHFSLDDAGQCASYFAVFSLSMFLWAAQSIYARAFYAAGNTWVPMVAGTVVTVVSWPFYGAFYRWYGAMGLAVASDLGIALQTATIAVLLHKRRMVSLASLDYAELGRCLLAGICGGGAAAALVGGVSWALSAGLGLHLWGRHVWMRNLGLLTAGAAVWLLLANVVLEKTGSALPSVVMRRLKLR